MSPATKRLEDTMTYAGRKMRRWMRQFCISKPHSLWKRYVLGFAFIFATISASHWASHETIKAAEDDAEVLSISNRQRMLSQRILFLMNEADRGNDPLIERRLESALDVFEMSHNWLISRPDLSPELQYLYFEKEPITLDAFSNRFIAMVGIASNAEGQQKEDLLDILAKWGKEDLISSLATAADLFREESEARVARLQMLQRLTLISALVVLLVEALVIFVPAQISVNTAIGRLQRRREQLVRSLEKLKQRNEELNDARDDLNRAANQDALTGLLNRRAIYARLNELTNQDQTNETALCVMKIDLDRFKQVNDTLGHNAGDALLRHVAPAMEKAVPVDSLIGRIGGDEFVVVIKNPANSAQVAAIAEDLVGKIGTPIGIENSVCKVGASIGYTFALTSSATPDQMLIEADLALYEAKRAGRGQALVYSDVMAQEIESRRLLFNEITRALADDQFEPHFQPQVFAKDRALYGCEVLARWRHPTRGIVSPATFIAAAEEAGLVAQIDRMMIAKSLDIVERLETEGIFLPTISINASPATLRDPFLTEQLLHDLKERHFSVDRLTVEVLESTLIENDDDEALKTVERLSDAGISVVLDDFGTGYASMSNLSFLRLNGIKLDQTLIRPVPDTRADSIVSALVTLSRNLDMRVVAEGVETEDQIRAVTALGCDILQGYGISRPLDANGLVQWYHAQNAQTAAQRA